MSDTVEIDGVPIQIVSQEEAEDARFVVCGQTSYFPDDVQTTCSACGAALFHRPHTPKTPPKICIACLLRRMQN